MKKTREEKQAELDEALRELKHNWARIKQSPEGLMIVAMMASLVGLMVLVAVTR